MRLATLTTAATVAAVLLLCAATEATPTPPAHDSRFRWPRWLRWWSDSSSSEDMSSPYSSPSSSSSLSSLSPPSTSTRFRHPIPPKRHYPLRKSRAPAKKKSQHRLSSEGYSGWDADTEREQETRDDRPAEWTRTLSPAASKPAQQHGTTRALNMFTFQAPHRDHLNADDSVGSTTSSGGEKRAASGGGHGHGREHKLPRLQRRGVEVGGKENTGVAKHDTDKPSASEEVKVEDKSAPKASSRPASTSAHPVKPPTVKEAASARTSVSSDKLSVSTEEGTAKLKELTIDESGELFLNGRTYEPIFKSNTRSLMQVRYYGVDARLICRDSKAGFKWERENRQYLARLQGLGKASRTAGMHRPVYGVSTSLYVSPPKHRHRCIVVQSAHDELRWQRFMEKQKSSDLTAVSAYVPILQAITAAYTAVLQLITNQKLYLFSSSPFNAGTMLVPSGAARATVTAHLSSISLFRSRDEVNRWCDARSEDIQMDNRAFKRFLRVMDQALDKVVYINAGSKASKPDRPVYRQVDQPDLQAQLLDQIEHLKQSLKQKMKSVECPQLKTDPEPETSTSAMFNSNYQWPYQQQSWDNSLYGRSYNSNYYRRNAFF